MSVDRKTQPQTLREKHKCGRQWQHAESVSSSAKRQKGFTLIEVMVAIGILATLGVVMLSSTSSSTANIAVMQDKIEALSIAEYALNTVLIAKDMPDNGVEEEVISRADRRWLVSVTVSETPNPNIKRVDSLVKPYDTQSEAEDRSTILLSGFKADLAPTP